MNQEVFIRLAEKYSQNKCTLEERVAVETFFEKLQKAEPNMDLSEEKRRLLLQKIKPQLTGKPTPKRKLIYTIAAAAVILFGIFSSLFLLSSSQTITQVTAKGEKKEVLLQDGTVVLLNANSRITYPSEFKQNRKVVLQGEAFFKVKRNEEKPFIVEVGKIHVKVLGTSFNVNAYTQDQPIVHVVSGRVELGSQDQETPTLILQKNQQAVLAGKDFLLSQEESADPIAWTKKIIVLQNHSLKETARILENWYDIKIDFEEKELEKMLISGKFKDEKLENVLQSIALLKDLKIDFITQKHVLIRRNHQQD